MGVDKMNGLNESTASGIKNITPLVYHSFMKRSSALRFDPGILPVPTTSLKVLPILYTQEKTDHPESTKAQSKSFSSLGKKPLSLCLCAISE